MSIVSRRWILAPSAFIEEAHDANEQLGAVSRRALRDATALHAPVDPMTAEVRLADVACTLDGLAALEQFQRLDMLYAAYLGSAEGAPDAADRRALLQIVRRLLRLVEPVDLFLQDCDEQIQRAKGPEYDRQVQEMLSSQQLGGVPAAELRALVDSGARRARAMLAEEAQMLAQELQELEAGRLPQRMSSVSASSDLAAVMMVGAGAAAFGAAAAATMAAAPKAAVVMLAVGGAVLEGAAIAIVVQAV